MHRRDVIRACSVVVSGGIAACTGTGECANPEEARHALPDAEGFGMGSYYYGVQTDESWPSDIERWAVGYYSGPDVDTHEFLVLRFSTADAAEAATVEGISRIARHEIVAFRRSDTWIYVVGGPEDSRAMDLARKSPATGPCASSFESP